MPVPIQDVDELEKQIEVDDMEKKSNESNFSDVQLSDPDLSTDDYIYAQYEAINRPKNKH